MTGRGVQVSSVGGVSTLWIDTNGAAGAEVQINLTGTYSASSFSVTNNSDGTSTITLGGAQALMGTGGDVKKHHFVGALVIVAACEIHGIADGRLFSLDAGTGRLDPAFGEGGILNLRKGLEPKFASLGYGPTSAPACSPTRPARSAGSPITPRSPPTAVSAIRGGGGR